MKLNPKVIEAREYAIKAHGNQKYSSYRPYVYHLDQVVEILDTYKYNDTIKIIAYLHDVIEDTHITVGKIIEKFGTFVGVCVSLLTDNMIIRKRSKRKKAFYKKISNVDKQHEIVLIVKAADRLANMKNKEKLDMYKKEYNDFKNAVYRPGLCDDIWKELNELARNSFYMKANITFEAYNIEDALSRLVDHFNNINDDYESDFILEGDLEVGPIEARTDEEPEKHDDYYHENVPKGYYK